MNVLIIYAHPNPKSFNHAVLEQVQKGLGESHHEVSVIDLYQEGFDPVLIFNEKRKRRDMKNDPEMARYRDLVKKADHYIFIYPVWWYGLPAILKGFFDRVFAAGFAYIYEGLVPKGLLTGKSAWVIYTIDSPGLFVRLVRGNVEWTVVKKAILQFCGIRPVKRMMLAGMKGSSARKRKRWLDTVYQQARQL
ncbi:flavodoxin family protein [Sporolactobacillus shoreae]|uniref:Flavodoxin family protein n=1 Tax=Sporolactobacillus shoreae TaxID=1465501 RepID=A0A4Z0GJN6_9BACL|nr:NAD(P)H-dependent oxidoreductase [Sporolactobacillus shoreae]TGA96225.1 flavodoxin family protein [Sporolactobacillus shoreae]